MNIMSYVRNVIDSLNISTPSKADIVNSFEQLFSYSPTTAQHSVNDLNGILQVDSLKDIRSRLGISEEDLVLASLFHDRGKLYLPKHILDMNCALDPNSPEADEIRRHVLYGYEANNKDPILSKYPFVAEVSYVHHSQFQPEGLLGNYPAKLIPALDKDTREKALLFCRDFCNVDFWDALSRHNGRYDPGATKDYFTRLELMKKERSPLKEEIEWMHKAGLLYNLFAVPDKYKNAA